MKKIVPYIFILLVSLGLFSPIIVNARTGTGQPENFTECMEDYATKISNGQITKVDAEKDCQIRFNSTVVPPKDETKSTALSDAVGCSSIVTSSFDGCIARLFYIIFYTIPSGILGIVARFFDMMLALTLGGFLYESSFTNDAWVVVRDLSNIFFILVLLYIAVKVILNLGGHDVKKMISQVVIMALLINFSMFFTKVVIDASNILALIFYNKIDVKITKNGKTVEPNQIPILDPKKAPPEKAMALKIVDAFDPTKLLDQEFFKKLEKPVRFSTTSLLAYGGAGAALGSFIPIVGTVAGGIFGVVGYALSQGGQAVPIPLIITIIIVAGSIMIFTAYTLFM
ncbi:hypothetical protein HZA26_03160, partial [Candidatus Nomurabacteria bacterium]|nr:hypothetical protein [Candidatus Nomurabacteria bacterium]